MKILSDKPIIIEKKNISLGKRLKKNQKIRKTERTENPCQIGRRNQVQVKKKMKNQKALLQKEESPGDSEERKENLMDPTLDEFYNL